MSILALCDGEDVPRGRSRRNKNGLQSRSPKPLNVAQKLMEVLQTLAIPHRLTFPRNRTHAHRAKNEARPGAALIKLGYKASAEQFSPAALLDFACVAWKKSGSIPFSSAITVSAEAHGRSRAVLASLARCLRGQNVTDRDGHERAHADVPLSPLDSWRRALRHARQPLSRARDPRGRHRRVAQLSSGDRQSVAGIQGAVRASARVDCAHPAVVERGTRDLRRRVLPHAERDDL